RWIVIVAITVFVIAGVLAYSFVQEPVYKAEATCMVSATTTGQDEYSTIQIIEKLLETIKMIAVSRPVLENTSDRLNNTRSPRQLQQSVSSKVVMGTQLIIISATDLEPLTAMLEANAAADSLIDFINQKEGSGSYKIEKVEPAMIPKSPASPKPVRDGILGGVLGLILGFSCAALLEYLDVSVKSKEELGQLLEQPVLAEIPLSNGGPTGHKAKDVPEDSGVLEATRTLRTNIQYMGIDANLRTILVTSPSLGEGKSFISEQLARAFAAGGKKVVLVDADLRKPGHPDAHSKGITDVMIGSVDVAEAVGKTETDGLWMLHSGPLPPNPSELLDSAAMQSILDSLRTNYDVIIIDSCPIGMFSDPLVLASRVDGTLLVVEARSTSVESLESATQLLSGPNMKLLGAVLNKVKLSKHHHYYYYYESRSRNKRRKKWIARIRRGPHLKG
ncbi:MAG: polysaccharide biosynthesis tyrosine autokinase, partial [Actinobacteria bacterium]|nr:polysaccharide biosynthesis tyrosine autokinase [Actinomycetota bacterium]